MRILINWIPTETIDSWNGFYGNCRLIIIVKPYWKHLRPNYLTFFPATPSTPSPRSPSQNASEAQPSWRATPAKVSTSLMCRCEVHSQESLVLKMLACLCIYVCACARAVFDIWRCTHTHTYIYKHTVHVYIIYKHMFEYANVCVCVCLSIATPSDWCTNHIYEHDPAGTCDHGAALESSEATNWLRAYWNGMATLGH